MCTDNNNKIDGITIHAYYPETEDDQREAKITHYKPANCPKKLARALNTMLLDNAKRQSPKMHLLLHDAAHFFMEQYGKTHLDASHRHFRDTDSKDKLENTLNIKLQNDIELQSKLSVDMYRSSTEVLRLKKKYDQQLLQLRAEYERQPTLSMQYNVSTNNYVQNMNVNQQLRAKYVKPPQLTHATLQQHQQFMQQQKRNRHRHRHNDDKSRRKN